MVARFSTLALVLALGAGCSVDALKVEGRTCSASHPCPPGFRCDPATNSCKATGSDAKTGADLDAGAGSDVDVGQVDRGRPDRGPSVDRGPKPDRRRADLKRPDLRRPDSRPPIDAGCPGGKVFCGGRCVDVSKDPDHCGGCNNRCSGSSDRCINKKCVCGVGSACTSGLNCIKGSCRCLNGGLCTGCCDSSSRCVALSATTTSKCGKAGAGCMPCTAGGQCVTAVCSSGSCGSRNKTNGTTCTDGNACTFGDKCTSGSCKGQAFTCNDGKSCTTDTCLGKAPPNSCSFPLLRGYCLIGGVCYSNGAKNPANSCQQCSSSLSTSRWTTISGCSSSATVTTLFSSSQARLPRGLYMPNNNTMYIADTSRHSILKATRSGGSWTVTTLAGAGSSGFADGTGAAAAFYSPEGLEMDTAGNLYVTDTWNNAVRKVTSTGVVTTIAGSTTAGLVNGVGTSARFNRPSGITYYSGELYVADQRNHLIRKIYRLTTTPYVSTFAGSTAGYADGSLTAAKFNSPYGLESSASGTLYVGDSSNHRLRMIARGTVSTVAGNGTRGSTDGASSSATFDYIKHLRLSPSGKLYIADYSSHKVRVLYAAKVSTLAGSGTNGYLDGPALSAQFRYPYDVAFDTVGYKVFVADYNSSKVRTINLSTAP